MKKAKLALAVLLALSTLVGTTSMWAVQQVNDQKRGSVPAVAGNRSNDELALGASQHATHPGAQAIPRFQIEYGSIISRVAWAPDGQRLATSTKSSGIHILDVASGKEEQHLTAGNTAGAIAFSSNGQALAVSEDGPVVSVWDIRTGRRQNQFKEVSGP